MTDSNRPKTIAASVTRPDSTLANPLNVSFRLNAFNERPNVTLLNVGNLTLEELYILVDKQSKLELEMYEVADSITTTTRSVKHPEWTPVTDVVAEVPKPLMGNRKILNESLKLASWKINAIRSAKTTRHVIGNLVMKFGVSSSSIKRIRSAKVEDIWVK